MASTNGLNSQYNFSYNSFAGCDIQATFAGIRIGELQGVSFSIAREKAPIFTMGNSDCRGYSRGKRFISGSFVLVMFDRSALLAAFQAANKAAFVTNTDVITQTNRRSSLVGGGQEAAGLTNLQDDITGISTNVAVATQAWYVDQLPPFTIVLNAINEYGHSASMAINGVEILNMGSGVSVDDITIDESMTFVATGLTPWTTERYIDPASQTRGTSIYKA